MTLYNIVQSLSPISFMYSINIHDLPFRTEPTKSSKPNKKKRKLQRSKQQQKCSQRFQIKYYILSSSEDPVPRRPPPPPQGRLSTLLPWKTQVLKTKLLLLLSGNIEKVSEWEEKESTLVLTSSGTYSLVTPRYKYYFILVFTNWKFYRG